jgi:hypothetical protein
MLNGINNNLTEPDALDRTILTEFKRIKPEQRKQEAEIEFRFEYMKPKLLGYIFDVLAKTLALASEVQLSDLPRMADFAVWGEAISRAMGYKKLEFINAYYDNIGRQNIEAIENHPLSQAIMKYFESNPHVGGLLAYPKRILEILEMTALEHGIDTNQRLWPRNVNWLTKRLNQISSNLLEGLGIEVTVTRTTAAKHSPPGGKYNMSSVKLRKISPVSPVSPGSNNLEGVQEQSTGQTGDTGDISGEIKDDDDTKNRRISSDKQEAFWRVWNELAALDSGVVDHIDLQDRLISTGKLDAGYSHYAIEQMLKLGEIVEVDYHRYKRSDGNSKNEEDKER